MYNYILFDLDGTLTDPKEGITKSVDNALKYFNINVLNLDDLKIFIGPPLKESFIRFYNLTEEEAVIAIDKYREYFSVKGIYENNIYPGINDLLDKLKRKGKKIYLATSKPTIYAIEILKYFNIFDYFDGVFGSNLDGTNTNKKNVIENVLLESQIIDKSQVIMIGDRKHDIIGANENEIDSIAVLYGYGSVEELIGAKPKYILTSVLEIEKIILE